MSSAAHDKSSDLWNQVLDILRANIHPQSFHTWFGPVVFAGCDESTCALTVPNAFFQDCILENYSGVLHSAIRDVFGAPRQIRISIRTSDPPSSSDPVPAPFDVLPACRLKAATPQDQWLIENLWLARAVGILGGPPRAYKSWIALDMAVSVASASPCLGVFPVPRSGPVLLYAAEDSDSSLRSRLHAIAHSRHIDFAQLDVRVITADRLRLDRPEDQYRFDATVALHQPQLIILDPLVRIHAADENASTAVAALLGYFRSLQRRTGASILLIHHSGKNLSLRTGYSLRGSSDFYAWTDCLLYLERRHDQRRLLVEHRSAPGSGPFTIELATPASPDLGPYPILHRSDETDAAPIEDSLSERILHLLSQSQEPFPAETLRARFRVRKQRLLETLRTLSDNGKIAKLPQGYTLLSTPS
jgi:hypothetical protein